MRQKETDGLGDAVLYDRKHVGDEPCTLSLGDTIIQNGTPCTKSLVAAAETHNSSVPSLERVPWGDVPSYGVANTDEVNADVDSFPVSDFVEKPPQNEAPSNLAITGRYVLTPEIFELLEITEKGVGGGLQLTDAIRKLDAVRGVELKRDRYDIGNIPSWLQANVEIALKHDDGEINTAVKAFLEDRNQ